MERKEIASSHEKKKRSDTPMIMRRANGGRWRVVAICLVAIALTTTPTVDAFRLHKPGFTQQQRSQAVICSATTTDAASSSSDAATTKDRKQEQTTAEELKQVAQELEEAYERSEGTTVAVIDEREERDESRTSSSSSDDDAAIDVEATVVETEDIAEEEECLDGVDASVAAAAESRRRRAAAALLGRSSGKRRTNAQQRKTSVGSARVGAASRARLADGNKAAKIFKGLERAAAAKSTKGEQKKRKNEEKNSLSAGGSTTTTVSPSLRSAIDGLIEQQKLAQEKRREIIRAAHVPRYNDMHRLLRHPSPGTVLMDNEISTIRLATTEDDEFIADLRLSVFSDFGPAFRQQFNARSQQVLASRRLRGATCLVASNIFSTERVVGSVELSIHEFHGTLLGRSRLPDSMLYITEVAVHPDSRRCGLGRKLLEAVDGLARQRGTVESLYLHVDVTNTAAIRLYESCGYRRMDPSLPMYDEFTRSLELHDGATKGRKHHLLCKDVVPTPTWLLDEASSVSSRPQLGFEVPQ